MLSQHLQIQLTLPSKLVILYSVAFGMWQLILRVIQLYLLSSCFAHVAKARIHKHLNSGTF